MEYIKCDRCGSEYHDLGSVKMAKDGQEDWKMLCSDDGVDTRGLCPCPTLTCSGEMILKEE